MAALANDTEAELLEAAHGVLMPHTGKLGHGSDGHFGFAYPEELGLVGFRRKPFPNCLSYVGQGFFACLALRMAATQRRTTHRDSVLMLDQCDPVFHGPRLVSWQRRIKPVRERKYPHHRTRLRPRRRKPHTSAQMRNQFHAVVEIPNAAGSSWPPIASLSQNPPTRPTVANRGTKRRKCSRKHYRWGSLDEVSPYR